MSVPHNFEAEQSLLGAILVNNKAFDKVSEFLKPEHFADPAHGIIYQTISSLISRGQQASVVILSHYLEKEHFLVEIGGTEYLAQLAGSVVSIINAGDYGRLIFDLHLRRELIALGTDVVNTSSEPNTELTACEIAHSFESQLFSLTETSDSRSKSRSFSDVVSSMMSESERARENGAGIIGLSTGLRELDGVMGGLAPGNLIVLGGRPAMGKSALLCSMGRYIAETQCPVGIFSLEMRGEEIAQRMTADIASIPYAAIRNGRMDAFDWDKLQKARKSASECRLHVDDYPGATMDQIRVRARRMVRRNGIGIVIIDHVHLIQQKAERRLDELTKISRSLKEMARELDVPVLALCQLSRSVESRDDKRPVMSDLRESGSLEQDADIVSFIYRHHYYLERDEPIRGERETVDKFTESLADWSAQCQSEKHKAQVLIQKNRHGQTGVVNLSCRLAFSRFTNMAGASSYDH